MKRNSQKSPLQDGWFNRFKARHNLKYKASHGEAKSADTNAVDKWVKEEWPNFLSQWKQLDIAVGFSANFLSHWEQLNAQKRVSEHIWLWQPKHQHQIVQDFEIQDCRTCCEDSSKAAKA